MWLSIISWRPAINPVTLAAGIIFGMLTHIVAIFALPYLAENNAWLKIGQRLEANTLQWLPQATPDVQLLPFMAPDVRYAMCRYDVGSSPVSLQLPFIGPLWSIAIYDRHANNFFFISGRDIKRKRIELLLNLPKTETTITQQEPVRSGGKSETITVRVLSPEGLIVVRAPVRSIAYRSNVARQLARASCRPAESGQS